MRAAAVRILGLGTLALALSAIAAVAFWASAETEARAIAPGVRMQLLAASPGRTLFQAKGCSGCHAVTGLSSSQIAPDLTHLPLVAGQRRPGYSAEAYVRESIADPQAFVVAGHGSITMPKLPVTDEEVDALVSFLLSQ